MPSQGERTGCRRGPMSISQRLALPAAYRVLKGELIESGGTASERVRVLLQEMQIDDISALRIGLIGACSRATVHFLTGSERTTWTGIHEVLYPGVSQLLYDISIDSLVDGVGRHRIKRIIFPYASTLDTENDYEYPRADFLPFILEKHLKLLEGLPDHLPEGWEYNQDNIEGENRSMWSLSARVIGVSQKLADPVEKASLPSVVERTVRLFESIKELEKKYRGQPDLLNKTKGSRGSDGGVHVVSRGNERLGDPHR